MRWNWWSLLLALVLAGSALAQPRPEVLILPVEMPGYYSPLDSEGLSRTLEAGLRKLSPNAQLQVSRAADLTAYGYTAGSDQPPTPAMAEKLCRAYGASHLAWISIRFQPDYQSDTGVLALAGAARLWGYSADRRKVMFDEPLSVVRVDQLKKSADDKAIKTAARQLATGCVGDLAYQLAGLARQRQVRPPASAVGWQPPRVDPATQSKSYKAMLTATQHYQRAVRDSSLVDITTSQAAMTRAWTSLNQKEREALKRDYPDIEDAMTQVPVYNYGGYYWGWGYSYPPYP